MSWTWLRSGRLKCSATGNQENQDQQNSESLSETKEDLVFEQLNPKKSTWVPPPGKFSSLDHYIQRCRTEIGQRIRNQNLTQEELNALKSLRNRTDIVIRPADKGGEVVVWDRDLYLEEAYKQLSDDPFYHQIDQDATQAQHKDFTNVIGQAISTCELPPQAKHLTVENPRTSKFYMLPKIRKVGNPGRPIVSACNCPTSNISAYLDCVMPPLVRRLPSYVKDTNHALQILESFTFSGPNRYLFTMDIKSLYTVIPNNDGLQALKYHLNLRPLQHPPTDTLVRLAELVLNLNSFKFGNQHYQRLGA